MKWITVTVAVLVAGALGAFAIYTFGWRNSSSSEERAKARADAEEVLSYIKRLPSRGCVGCRVGEVKRVAPQIWRVRLEDRNGAPFQCFNIHLDKYQLATNHTAGIVRVVCP